jgi:hypothetical protein
MKKSKKPDKLNHKKQKNHYKMKTFFITTIAFLALTVTCSAQWTLPGVNISNTNTGNVGIGTTNPFKKLHVAGFLMASTMDYVSTGTGSSIYIGQEGATGNVYSLIQASTNGNNGSGVLSLNKYGGNVGIGTTTPLAKLHVLGGEIRITGAGVSGSGSGANITFYDSDNTTRRGFVGDGSSGNTDIYLLADVGGALNFGANGVASKMFISTIGNVGIGTINPDAKLTVNGTIHSLSVVVDTNIPVPDYVFKNDYNLPSLAEIKTYTDKNHHLPGVPAAAELEKNGIDLGEMNMTLLKKVEELTLYLIEKDKQLQEQQKINKDFKQQLIAIKSQQKLIDEMKINLDKLNHKKTK